MNIKDLENKFNKYTDKLYNKSFRNSKSLNEAIKKSMKRTALKLFFANINLTAIHNCIIESKNENLFKDTDYDFYSQNFNKICCLIEEILNTLEDIFIKKAEI